MTMINLVCVSCYLLPFRIRFVEVRFWFGVACSSLVWVHLIPDDLVSLDDLCARFSPVYIGLTGIICSPCSTSTFRLFCEPVSKHSFSVFLRLFLSHIRSVMFSWTTPSETCLRFSKLLPGSQNDRHSERNAPPLFQKGLIRLRYSLQCSGEHHDHQRRLRVTEP